MHRRQYSNSKLYRTISNAEIELGIDEALEVSNRTYYEIVGSPHATKQILVKGRLAIRGPVNGAAEISETENAPVVGPWT